MDTAGHPAPTAAKQPHDHLTAEGTAQGDNAPGAPTPGGDLSSLLALGTRRRAEHSRQDAQRPEDWADPDPGACGALSPVAHPVERFLAKKKAGRSRRDKRSAVRRTCERLLGVSDRRLGWDEVLAYPWHQITPDAAADFRRTVYAATSVQSSRNDAVSVLRCVVDQCHSAKLISALRRDLLLDELYTAKPGASRRGRCITPAELRSLMLGCERDEWQMRGARDAAILVLLWTTGMRGIELVQIDIADVDLEDATIVLRDTKNGGDHVVFLHPDVLSYLHRWLRFRGAGPGPLFTPARKPDKPLHPGSVRSSLQSLAQRTGVKKFGLHDYADFFVMPTSTRKVLQGRVIVVVGSA